MYSFWEKIGNTDILFKIDMENKQSKIAQIQLDSKNYALIRKNGKLKYVRNLERTIGFCLQYVTFPVEGLRTNCTYVRM